MNFDKANAALDSVYSAETPEALAKAYAEWAATYDGETASLGYLLPFLITAWVARHVPAGEGPLLDAGCGTGLSGPSLKALGYGDIAGLDLSDDMLKIAGSRNAYGELKKAMLGGPLPWPDSHFRAFFSTGVFTIGHAPAEGLHELVRITKSGGHAIFTVRDQVFESGGFQAVFDDLRQARRWRLAEESPWFRCYAIGDPHALVKTFVFEVL
ncbi:MULTISPECIES: class I SAM-dependent methyltransferase [unclassified Mesorhizobium]|uniref:class I SAM-dependent DNA methyltransferase n=1 Tax=unclassified Mesorhizobium TaxID=325217 RepID=UPI0007FF68AB|nr:MULTISPECIES: class I SAM-dependent methyltransferase [unclassified Mesorhizobium]OBQ95418.1 SAM-dependent methyltransferase [Mesorhizobium sp. AA23]RWI90852.1 MAG: class I SAM-dependent methyltransferase [Mesorhizobium sp.]TIQ04182.1 MAG: class I SAM-dependent methyltransferase [Mesorhizobium sp.]TIR20760.1 MAG: class I SAM-dependent methyltransferase [Mesorhizobium sp.]